MLPFDTFLQEQKHSGRAEGINELLVKMERVTKNPVRPEPVEGFFEREEIILLEVINSFYAAFAAAATFCAKRLILRAAVLRCKTPLVFA